METKYNVWMNLDGDDFLIGTYANIDEALSVVAQQRQRGLDAYITTPVVNQSK